MKRAFTLVELLVVMAVIGIMSAMILSTVINASQDSRRVVARQQQAVVQNALNAWIANASSGTNSLQDVITLYNSNSTPLGRLALLQPYLHAETYSHFVSNSTGATPAGIRSDALRSTGQYLTFSAWTNVSSYPMVQMNP